MSETITTYNEDYINNLLETKAEETTYLEFKACDAFTIHPKKTNEDIKNDIAKDISAFANADGGILIYGIEEKDNIASNYSFIDGNQITTEWLQQVIDSRIFRKIEGIQITPIRFNNKFENTIYVVDIPRSSNAPHQTKNKKFHKRKNSVTDEMEEYEIRDLYNRKTNTQLEILDPIFNASYNVRQHSQGIDFNSETKIGFLIKNIGNSIEELYKMEIRMPKNIVNQSGIHTIGQTFFNHRVLNNDKYAIFSFPCTSPIFQNEILTITNVSLQIDKYKIKEMSELPIKLKLYYSNGVVEKEVFFFDRIDNIKDDVIVQELIKQQC